MKGRKYFTLLLVSLLLTIVAKSSDSLEVTNLGKISLSQVYKNPDSARVLIGKAMVLCKKENNHILWASTWNYNGIYHDVTGNYDSAKICYLMSLSYSSKTNNYTIQAGAYNNIGLLFWNRRELDSAITYYFKALDVYEQYGSKKGMANVYSNIGLVYNRQYREKEALVFDKKALKIRREINDSLGIGKSLANIGGTYEKMKEFDSTIYYYNMAEPYFIISEDNYSLATLYHDKAATYNIMGQAQNGIPIAKNALEIRRKLKSKKYIASTLNLLGSLYLKGGFYNKGHLAIDEAIGIYKKYHVMKELSMAYQRKAELYKKEGVFDKSLIYLEKRMAITDSLQEESKIKGLIEIEEKYKNEKAKRQLLEKDKILVEKQRQTMFLWMGLFLLSLLIIAIFVFFKTRIKRNRVKKHNELLEQKVEISRELHDNIGSQLTYISMGLDDAIKTTEKSNLVDLKNFAKQTIGDLRTTVWGLNKAVTMEDLSQKIADELSKVKAYGIDTQIAKSNSNLIIESTVAINTLRIVQEAIQNAVKHAKTNFIGIEIKDTPELIYAIVVQDKGNGLVNEKTSGFGLKSMKQRAKKIGAELNINCKKGEGTAICLQLNKTNAV